MQKSHQNIHHDHAQTEELVKYVRESIWHDYMIKKKKNKKSPEGWQ